MFRHLSGCPSLTLQHLLQTPLAGTVFYLSHQTRTGQTNPRHSPWQEKGAAVRQTDGRTKQGGTDSTHYSVFAQLPGQNEPCKEFMVSLESSKMPMSKQLLQSSANGQESCFPYSNSLSGNLMRLGQCQSFPDGCQSAKTTVQVRHTSCNAYPG